MHTGVIPLVFQTDGGKLQISLSILSRELTAVLLPGRSEERGAQGRRRLQGAGEPVGRLLRPRRDYVLLHPGLIHACLSCRDTGRFNNTAEARGWSHVIVPQFELNIVVKTCRQDVQALEVVCIHCEDLNKTNSSVPTE